MDLELQGTGVLVTGGTRGIGREIALAFASEGANVAVCGRTPDHVAAACAEIEARGAKACGICLDLAGPGAPAEAVAQAAGGLGRLDTLVNNASPDVLTRDVADPILERLMGKTMVAIRTSEAAVPLMVQGGGGSIVMIGGTSVRQPFSGREMGTRQSTTASGVSNAAVGNYAKHLATEVMSQGIRVNLVLPHFTKTGRYGSRLDYAAQQEGLSPEEAEAFLASWVPAGRLPEPSDIAPMVLFFASPRASMITGQAVAVDGGAVKTVVY